jgi:hypothetical protein
LLLYGLTYALGAVAVWMLPIETAGSALKDYVAHSVVTGYETLSTTGECSPLVERPEPQGYAAYAPLKRDDDHE